MSRRHSAAVAALPRRSCECRRPPHRRFVSPLFAGSDTAGERATAIYTLIQTAKLNDVNPEAYPKDILTIIADVQLSSGLATRARRVVVKVECHPRELYPRVGFIVTNMSRAPERVTLFYHQQSTAEQHITERKNAFVWTRLSCHHFAANAVRL